LKILIHEKLDKIYQRIGYFQFLGKNMDVSQNRPLVKFRLCFISLKLKMGKMWKNIANLYTIPQMINMAPLTN